jgi:hypothetical protein
LPTYYETEKTKFYIAIKNVHLLKSKKYHMGT